MSTRCLQLPEVMPAKSHRSVTECRQMTSIKEASDNLFKEWLKRPDVKHNKPRQQHHGPAPPARSWQQSEDTT